MESCKNQEIGQMIFLQHGGKIFHVRQQTSFCQHSNSWWQCCVCFIRGKSRGNFIIMDGKGGKTHLRCFLKTPAIEWFLKPWIPYLIFLQHDEKNFHLRQQTSFCQHSNSWWNHYEGKMCDKFVDCEGAWERIWWFLKRLVPYLRDNSIP